MRLMLGQNSEPSLLVDAKVEYGDRTKFSFWVVNGAWEGRYNNGYITILGPIDGDYSSLDPVEILCDDQDRLRGDYQDVFDNFDDPNYVAPKFEHVVTDFDDDIAF